MLSSVLDDPTLAIHSHTKQLDICRPHMAQSPTQAQPANGFGLGRTDGL